MINLDSLKQLDNISFREKRTGLYKVIVPFFYEDGDMYDIFIEESPINSGLIRISDYGLSLMKLSYSFDFDTDNKRETLKNIISQNRAHVDDGSIWIDVNPSQFQIGIYQFAQVITKISNMEIISRENIKSFFNEFLGEFISEQLSKIYNVIPNYAPMDNTDLVVDYKIEAPKPIFLFGVNDNTKASKVVISCLNFQTKNLPFRSLIVHEDLEKLSKFNQKQITNAADKQFYTLDDFKEGGNKYIDRELKVS